MECCEVPSHSRLLMQPYTPLVCRYVGGQLGITIPQKEGDQVYTRNYSRITFDHLS